MNFNSSFNGNFLGIFLTKLIPRGSHVVLTAFVLVMLVALLFAFLSSSNLVVFFTFSGIFLIMLLATCTLWLRSHHDIDQLPPSHFNVEYTDKDGSTSVSFPSASIKNAGRMADLERILSVLRHRAPLPEPDGLVGASGEPIPKAVDMARERVNFVNDQIKKADDALRTQESLTENSDKKILQQKIEGRPSFLGEYKVNQSDTGRNPIPKPTDGKSHDI